MQRSITNVGQFVTMRAIMEFVEPCPAGEGVGLRRLKMYLVKGLV